MKNQLSILKKTFFIGLLSFFLLGCENNQRGFVTVPIPNNNWLYADKIRLTTNITDISKTYNVCFMLRHTLDYKYSNIFVLFHLKNKNEHLSKRFEYTLAKSDGEWMGQGSGNLFTNTLILLKNYRFKKPGKYTFEVEQNMRDNPLNEISDAGLFIEINN